MFGIFEPEWRKLGYSSKREYEDAMVSAIEDRSKQDIQIIRAQGKRELEAIEKQGEESLNRQKAHYKKELTEYSEHVNNEIHKIQDKSKERSKEHKKRIEKIDKGQEQKTKEIWRQHELDGLDIQIKGQENRMALMKSYATKHPDDASWAERLSKMQNRLDSLQMERDKLVKKYNL